MDKTKRGIALFITLLVIASILSIVAVSFSYLEKVQKDAGKVSSLIQGNLLYKNTTDILKKFFPKGKVDSKKLQMVYSLPLMIEEPKSGFNINLDCKPLLVGIPINWLDENFDKNITQKFELSKKVLSYIMEKYEIEEPNRLEELILGAVTGQIQYDREYKPRLQARKGISSKKQFDKIILNYRMRYDDTNVFKVPWDRYFVFVDVTKRATIDGEYITPELISASFDIPLESVKDDWKSNLSISPDNIDNIEDKQTLKDYLADNGIGGFDKKIFSKKALNVMHCQERYSYRDLFYSFNFDYSEGRSKNFEFNGEI
ncbi:MAG: hypothetical protein KAU90_03075 [Sulfurovaceae bacterium]|nr:hypothetical protein [Sulfurovaceae bacterium]